MSLKKERKLSEHERFTRLTGAWRCPHWHITRKRAEAFLQYGDISLGICFWLDRCIFVPPPPYPYVTFAAI
jgi:hypothetical protein